jgi:choline dehydrogenase-like flavoprotein
MAFDRFRDARTIENGAIFNADVCIAGTGPAGITLARELTRSGVRVVLLEAGGLSIDPAVNALSTAENIGRPYEPNQLRLRYFGGTANHWGGHCVPLSPSDFAAREWIPHTGWPYDFNELRPYYERAHDVLEIGAFDYDVQSAARELNAQLLPFNPQSVETTVSRHNAMRFGLRYGDELNAAPTLTCILYADLSAIDLASAESERVTKARVRSVAENEFTVRARYYVVACGGIENPRILLCSNHQRAAGLGNHSDMVGRCFMEHVHFESGYLLPTGKFEDYLPYTRDAPDAQNVRTRLHLSLPIEEQRRQQIPAFRTELVARSHVYLEAWSIKNRGLGLHEVGTLLSHPFELGAALRCRDTAQPNVMAMRCYVEQIPSMESRITLSEAKDAMGRPQARVNWRLSAMDHEGIVKAQQVIAREVGRANLGRFRVGVRHASEVEAQGGGLGGAHHMGTTRMHDDPRHGVTDADGRVHHTQNLFMAGSSLFPNCGYANPTLTIVATSIRMADQLKRRLGRAA